MRSPALCEAEVDHDTVHTPRFISSQSPPRELTPVSFLYSGSVRLRHVWKLLSNQPPAPGAAARSARAPNTSVHTLATHQSACPKTYYTAYIIMNMDQYITRKKPTRSRGEHANCNKLAPAVKEFVTEMLTNPCMFIWVSERLFVHNKM